MRHDEQQEDARSLQGEDDREKRINVGGDKALTCRSEDVVGGQLGG